MVRSTYAAILGMLLSVAPMVMGAGTSAPSADEIQTDLSKAFSDYHEVVKFQNFDSPQKRNVDAQKALPLIHRIVELSNELASIDPGSKDVVDQNLAVLHMEQLVYGDKDQIAVNDAAIARGETIAKAERLAANYAQADTMETKLKAADAFGTVFNSDASDPKMNALFQVISSLPVSWPTVDDQLLKIAKTHMDDPNVALIAQQVESDAHLLRMVDKPIVLSGTLLDGSQFSTAAWKGKVILVDFWATWCPVCVEEMPHTEEIYSKYHSSGLEVLGISSDYTADDLKKFLADNPAMRWPQMFDAKSPQGNPVATRLGVFIYPTMLLIDRKGVLRSVHAGIDMDEMIPKLLGEKGDL